MWTYWSSLSLGMFLDSFDLAALRKSLNNFFDGRKVDLLSFKSLNRHIRDEVLAEAEEQYAEG